MKFNFILCLLLYPHFNKTAIKNKSTGVTAEQSRSRVAGCEPEWGLKIVPARSAPLLARALGSTPGVCTKGPAWGDIAGDTTYKLMARLILHTPPCLPNLIIWGHLIKS